MDDDTERDFFSLRQSAKTYISKVFKYNARSTERIRQVRMVLEGSDEVHLGEIEGAMCLRLTGEKRKNQVTAIITQDSKELRRLTLQTFRSRSNDKILAEEKEEFTFRGDEFNRLLQFLDHLKFIDLSNEDNFKIEDISKGHGPKAIIDASDRELVNRIKGLQGPEREAVFEELRSTLSPNEINLLLGRRQGLEEFEHQMVERKWSEDNWQDFFERHPWVFGYGLDYRILRPFDREMTVGGWGTDNQNKPIVDFLMTFKDYTALVEIKTPSENIFRKNKGGRSGTWEFSAQFTSAISQVLEQKAEWTSFAQHGDHFDKSGKRKLEARTRNAKAVLVIGSRDEFDRADDQRSGQIMRDTFELFRQEIRTIEILTFDELLERARFITKNN